jgi:putative transposase
MPGPHPLALDVPAPMRRRLDQLVRRRSTPQQVAQRARVILSAADGSNNSEIARQTGLHPETVRHWRRRWVALQDIPPADLSIEDRLADAPRSGRPARIGAEQVCRIRALACEAPSLSGRPIGQWGEREIAEEIVKRGIVDRISTRHAARLVKKGACNRTGSATG